MAERNERARSREWHFTIDAFTPDSLPMARLADYLAQLARMLGETRSVHLVRIEHGSTVLVHEIEEEALPSVKRRVKAVREGRGSGSANEAFQRMNGYLAEDDARARLQIGGAEADVLVFPGSSWSQPDVSAVRQTASVSGVVVRVGGIGKRVPVLLASHGRQTAGCHADRTTAKKLARHLFEPVRLFGEGQWSRGTDDIWDVDRFSIERFEPLDEAKLSEVLDSLREVTAAWPDDLYLDLEAIRGTGAR